MLDGDFSDENRNKCRAATTPLLEAVENLSTFANNPDFASIPPQISNEVFMVLMIIWKPCYLCCIFKLLTTLPKVAKF